MPNLEKRPFRFLLVGTAFCFAAEIFASQDVPVSRDADSSSRQQAPSAGKPDMQDNPISAEIEPSPNNARQAASALQRLGFRILRVGTTISVDGPESLWSTVFGVDFVTRPKTTTAEAAGSQITYRKALTEHPKIPPDLRPFIAEVMFVEPPEFYRTRPGD